MSDNNFRYTYTAPTEAERREIEEIRKTYAEEKKDKPERREIDKMAKLRELHRKVTAPAKAVLAIGIALGVLIFGAGMSVTLVVGNYYVGIPIGAVGIALLCAVRPIYKSVLKRGKKKYGGEIMSLSEELLNVKK